ncbi:MAG: hypothetical protein QNJ72_12415 [Pleurocapsa sp. MO_226.B13]|nr:hypothetical protein [Pleurocapsa sp. MO_226.B13]
MSKIQFNELNLNASELEVLNTEETTEVVGGYWYGYGSYYSSYYSDNDFAVVQQSNYNSTQQAAFGGYYGNTINDNYTNQNNSANIYQ